MSDFNDQWTQEQHDRREADWRRDLGDELELLDDHEHVRIGDRFGSVVCHRNLGDERGHNYTFVDAGPWLPPEQRPIIAREQWSDDEIALYGPQPVDQPMSHYDYKLYLEEQEGKDRGSSLQVFHVAMQAARRDLHPLLMEMRQEIAEQQPTPAPVLTIRCSTLQGGRPCRQLMAKLWNTEPGLYGVSTVAPSRNAAEVIKTYGDEEHRAFAGVETSHEFAPEYADTGKYSRGDTTPWAKSAGANDIVPMACPDHGNAFVSASALVAGARSTRRWMNVDTANAKHLV